MPTEDAYSSGHLVLSHFGTCKCSNVETNISWTCLVSGLLSFEHPSVLLFLLIKVGERSEPRKFWQKCVFNHKIWANSEIRTFALPKSGGGGHKPTCAPHFWKWGGGGSCPPPLPPLLLRPWSPPMIVKCRISFPCALQTRGHSVFKSEITWLPICHSKVLPEQVYCHDVKTLVA